MRKKIFTLLFWILLVFPLGEIAARLLGYTGLKWVHYEIKTSPTNCITGDSLLGFRLNPGKFNVTINGGLKYVATHLNSKNRYCDTDTNSSHTIGFFGCSFTYGMGVEDSATFVAQIARKLPETHVLNYSVPGYGTVQTLQLLQQLEGQNKLPDTIVVCFSNLHFKRNGLTPGYRRDLVLGYAKADHRTPEYMRSAAFPYFSGKQIKTEKWEDLYSNWPGREYSALVNYLQSLRDRKQEQEIDTYQLTREAFDAILKITQEKHLLVLMLDEGEGSDRLSSYLSANRIQIIHGKWDINNPEETNAPFDDHLNPAAHKRIADLLIPYLL